MLKFGKELKDHGYKLMNTIGKGATGSARHIASGQMVTIKLFENPF